MATIELDLDIRRDPDTIRRWWLDFPDDYRAKDPKEQPFRIVTKARKDDEIVVDTYWKTPFGAQRSEEVLRVRPDGSWTADTKAMGFHVHDEFRVAPTSNGSRLRVESTLTPATPAARLLRPLLVPMMRRMFTRVWTDAAAICERDAA